jgi:hypothetical protein
VERYHGQFGRRAAIYALMPEGNQIFVPLDYPADGLPAAAASAVR